MERLDQGYLHSLPKQLETDMSQPGIEPGWEASALAKRYSNSLLMLYRNIISRQCKYNCSHRKQIYWAKDIIFLITEHEFLGAQVTLSSFTNYNTVIVLVPNFQQCMGGGGGQNIFMDLNPCSRTKLKMAPNPTLEAGAASIDKMSLNRWKAYVLLICLSGISVYPSIWRF